MPFLVTPGVEVGSAERSSAQNRANVLLGSTKELRRAVIRRRRSMLRRQANVVAAWIVLLLAAPVMLLIAACIKLLAPGPTLTKEIHVGIDRRLPLADSLGWRRHTDLGGRPFALYRFRTAVPAPARDRSILGRLRAAMWHRFSRALLWSGLDRLPQLVNVIRGDMNLLGPRPETPALFAAKRAGLDHFHGRRLRVLPGVAGGTDRRGGAARQRESRAERWEIGPVERASGRARTGT